LFLIPPLVLHAVANAANAVGTFLDIFTVRAVSLHLMQQLIPNYDNNKYCC
jgi:hypothetical protein